MKTTELREIFEIEYGNQYDLNKMRVVESGGINFVSRTSKNLGIVCQIEETQDSPFLPGAITVTLGGTYLLSSFVQSSRFYTAQNIKVLVPKTTLSFGEKLFYCKAIEANRPKYTSHGREANKTLDFLEVPIIDEIPDWAKDLVEIESIDALPKSLDKLNLKTENWATFKYSQLFIIERGKGPRKRNLGIGSTPFVSATENENGWSGVTNSEPNHPGNVITVPRNGASVAEAYYQPLPFCSTEDVHVFHPKFNLTTEIAMFLISLIRLEKYRFSYGRKWGESKDERKFD